MNPDLCSYPGINTDKSNTKDINKQHANPLTPQEHSEQRGNAETNQDYLVRTQENDRNDVYPVVPYPAADAQPVVPKETPLTQDDPVRRESSPPRSEPFDKNYAEDTKSEGNTPGGRHAHMVCSDCGHVVLGPERCAECGRVLPPPPDLCPLCGQALPEDWLYDDSDSYRYNPRFRTTSICRAGTSRKLYKLSGEHGSEDESEESSDSEDYGNAGEKPITIADSATLLRKNRWQAFRNYFRWFRAPHKFLKLHKTDSFEENQRNFV